MKVYLIRHTAVDVPSGTCYGQTDVPLKSTFETEAAQTLRNLSGTHFDHVYSSPLSRARRLAGYCGYPDPECDDRLMEINFGEWEMQRFDAISDPRLQEWFDDYFHVAATGGESFEDLYRRVAAFLDELKRSPVRKWESSPTAAYLSVHRSMQEPSKKKQPGNISLPMAV